MAQHYIYDDKHKNRVKMVLNDEEYARYNKLGCGSKLILGIIVIFVIIIFIGICKSVSEGEENNSKEIENVDTREGYQVETSPEYSGNSIVEDDNNTTESSSSVETAPVSEDNVKSNALREEFVEQSSPEIDNTSSIEDPEQEQQLTRKERRALRKAQKKLDKEEKKRRKLAEKGQDE